jgi:hypothetical protein
MEANVRLPSSFVSGDPGPVNATRIGCLKEFEVRIARHSAQAKPTTFGPAPVHAHCLVALRLPPRRPAITSTTTINTNRLLDCSVL